MKGSARLGKGIGSLSARSPRTSLLLRRTGKQQAYSDTISSPGALRSLIAVKTGNAVQMFSSHSSHWPCFPSRPCLLRTSRNFTSMDFEFFNVLNFSSFETNMCSPFELERASHHHIIHRIEGAAGVPLCSCSALKPVCR